ncbi:hypothetical protein A2272_03965 [Candidatus Peregrinibacteria bacterium RIFOXYA12_FULL_33_12]|nr:MAG: hypothetical protein A2263_03725 [Candidatus Peregrinibacteria bacterium RIFOXYA2_FULL_33_21]OGJ46590.1 MAG: hypothetical protein A2272_03965 [Candidatus Peregrinibacteria bacterium RIFOXYA12_FULL_33_12]OGJ51468.1 MAG: hypothetical protein A2307_00160 [Candidatus Peregrinibacteria bacterium RIFOXYB2_FULL_33_20]
MGKNTETNVREISEAEQLVVKAFEVFKAQMEKLKMEGALCQYYDYDYYERPIMKWRVEYKAKAELDATVKSCIQAMARLMLENPDSEYNNGYQNIIEFITEELHINFWRKVAKKEGKIHLKSLSGKAQKSDVDLGQKKIRSQLDNVLDESK